MTDDEKTPQAQYDPPQVEQIPTDSGPAVNAAGVTGGGGPEWRPAEPPSDE